MDLIIAILKYSFFGFFGLIGLLIAVVIIFGSRIVKKWDYEAEFRDESGKEFGEFDIELSHILKKEPDYSVKAKFRMRHDSMRLHSTVQVYLDQLLVLEGMVKKAGRVRLTAEHLQNDLSEPQTGQLCRVVCGGVELFSQQLVPD